MTQAATTPEVPMVSVLCPACGGGLVTAASTETVCPGCAARYPARAGRGPDLRPRSELRRTAHHRIPPAVGGPGDWETTVVDSLRQGDGPTLEDADSPFYVYGNRLTPALVSRLGLKPGYRLLDLGCGPDNHMRDVLEGLDVELVGVDYDGDGPDYLVDAHCLPFPDDSFDGVLSIAVLEHLRGPHLAVQEVSRVLRPGGVFAGTVAFLEPFHLASCFHHTAYGTWMVLNQARFAAIEIEPNRKWDFAQANLEMGWIPGLPLRIRALLGNIASGLAHLAWRVTRRNTTERYARFAGGFRFVAEMPT